MKRWTLRGFRYLYMLVFFPLAMRFEKKLKSPEKAQRALLKQILRQLHGCDYGKRYYVGLTDGYTEFSSKVPISNYEKVRGFIEQSMQSSSVVTSDPILFYEVTSGSTGPRKYIPYTKNMKKIFTHMFLLWVYDFFKNGYVPSSGKFFASLSPPVKLNSPFPGVKVGTEHDSDYLSGVMSFIIDRFLIKVSTKNISNGHEGFQKSLAMALLQEKELEVVSIWSPTYWLCLLDFIAANKKALEVFLVDDSQKEALRRNPIQWDRIWPQLKWISCWGDHSAKPFYLRLREKFPYVKFQKKGLLATEGAITFPWMASGGNLPLVDYVFYEFICELGKVHLLHQLQSGQIYEVVISHLSGLYRYRMGDQVKVTGFYHQTPILRFVGRTDEVSDMVGEKISIDAISSIIETLATKLREINLVAIANWERLGYDFYFEDSGPWDESELCAFLDSELGKNYHYQNARYLGQLKPPKVFRIPHLTEKIKLAWLDKGIKWGDQKDPFFIYDPLVSSDISSFLNKKVQRDRPRTHC